MDESIMELARTFWFGMRAAICHKGPPTESYFAYMPSRPDDIVKIRLWKPTDFMDSKKEWDKRQLLKFKQEPHLY